MDELIQLEDHRLLQEQARREGCCYLSFLRRLYSEDIPLETALRNARVGTTIDNYLLAKDNHLFAPRENKSFSLSAAIIDLVLSLYYLYIHERPSESETSKAA